MHVRGPGEHRPSTLGLPKQMFNRTSPRYSLHPSLSNLHCVSLTVNSHWKILRGGLCFKLLREATEVCVASELLSEFRKKC